MIPGTNLERKQQLPHLLGERNGNGARVVLIISLGRSYYIALYLPSLKEVVKDINVPLSLIMMREFCFLSHDHH